MSGEALSLPRGSVQRTGEGLRFDPALMGIVLSILLLGLVMVTSASISIASQDGGNPFAYLERQLLLVFGGLVLALLLSALPTSFLERYSTAMLAAAIALLVLVLVPGIGHVVNGSRRWIRLVGFNLQASEVARVLVLVWLASYAVRRDKELRSTLSGLLKPLAMLVLMCGLLLLEPDFGAASVLFATGFGLLFLAGAQLRWVLASVVLAASGFALLAVTSSYRLRRLTTFLDPWSDPYDSGFQLTQSLIAIGRGQWFGVGLGESVQKLFYLPEAHTDFLFAVLAEELGLAGVLLTLALFLALVWRVFGIARMAANAGLKFQSYLAAAFALWVGIQAMINIGVNMGALPTKGLTLPLMSYGRSSMLVALAWLGIVMRVHHEASVAIRGAASPQRRRAAEVDE
ncbi:MAG: putative lipid II flippase FtsW [Nevskiaceae bacterium]|jgi:cell division protein FtsW|nr:putative lipid II flippase FtsW [Nevskiaceae bacterium]